MMSSARDDTGEPTRRSVAIAGHTGDGGLPRRALDNADPSLRATALGALERLGILDDATLAGALRDPSPVVRRRAATIAVDHPTIDLRELLDDPDPTVVEVAAWAVGERTTVGDDVLERVAALVSGHDDALVREASVAALGAIGDDRGLDAILAATADKPAIRRRAILALAPFLDPEHDRADDVAAALTKALGDRDWQVRQAAEDLIPVDD